jgi:hypothetical protein
VTYSRIFSRSKRLLSSTGCPVCGLRSLHSLRLLASVCLLLLINWNFVVSIEVKEESYCERLTTLGLLFTDAADTATDRTIFVIVLVIVIITVLVIIAVVALCA